RVPQRRRDASLVAAPTALRDRERVDARPHDLRITETIPRVRAANASVVSEQTASQRAVHVRRIGGDGIVIAVVQQMTENEHAVLKVRLVVAQVRAEALAE